MITTALAIACVLLFLRLIYVGVIANRLQERVWRLESSNKRLKERPPGWTWQQEMLCRMLHADEDGVRDLCAAISADNVRHVIIHRDQIQHFRALAESIIYPDLPLSED